MLRSVENLMRGAASAKRIRPWLAVFLVVFLLGCDGSETSGPAAAPVTVVSAPLPAPAPIRRIALEVPEGVPEDEERIQFYLGLLEAGNTEHVKWASEQLGIEAGASAGPLARMLTASLVKNTLLAENILQAMAAVVPAPDELEALAAAAGSTDGRVRLMVARALGNTGSEGAVPVLLDLAADPIDPVALEALKSIEHLGFMAGIVGLVGRFPDQLNPSVAIATVGVVAGRLATERLEPFLLTAWESEEPGLVLASARGLLGLDREAWLPRVRKRLLPFIDGTYRRPAMEALAIGNDPELLASLIQDAASSDPALAVPAVGLLSFYDSEEAIQALWKATRQADQTTRREAWFALIEAGESKAFKRLKKLLESPDPGDRVIAAEVLAARREHPSGPEMTAALEREEAPGVARKLAVGIALLGYRPGTEAIAGLLGRETQISPSLSVDAFAASTALLNLGSVTPAAAELLVSLAESKNEAIRMNTARVLGRTCSGPAVMSALAALLRDPSVHVRRQALMSWLALKGATVAVLSAAYAVETDPDLLKEIPKTIQQLHYRWPR